MPVSPAPVLPGTSPLPPSGQQPPSRRALRLGALIALPLLVVALVVGQLLLPTALFLVPGLQAQAGTNLGGTGGFAFQGFVYPWTRRDTDANSGYTASVSLQNMQSEASIFHMNAVIIPVVADMPERSERYIAFHNNDKNDLDTLPLSDYIQAIKDARKAGLVPILELQVLQQDPIFAPDESSANVGAGWSDTPSYQSIYDEENQPNEVKALERGWFDYYSAFAVEYAQVSQQYHLPYFIFGDGLTNVSYDTSETNAQTDPNGIPSGACPKNTIGRRDCEWRHVIQAIRSQTYNQIWSGAQETGGGYTGKLIYAANWDGASDGGASAPEFESITWWDAVDYIGINAGFPLTHSQRDPSLGQLMQAWHGQGTDLGGQSDIYSRIQKVSEKYDKPVIFTSAGYNSVGGANSQEFQSGADVTPQEDDGEQYNDMQALLETFGAAPWWTGVFWEGDAPIPRDKQANWAVSTAWAGTTLANSKPSGQWLAQYYKPAPIPCSC